MLRHLHCGVYRCSHHRLDLPNCLGIIHRRHSNDPHWYCLAFILASFLCKANSAPPTSLKQKPLPQLLLMKSKYLFLVLLLHLGMVAKAQIPMGTWKFHVASAKAIDTVSDGERIFTALENGLYIYNPYTEEGVLKTALNGLSDIAISRLYHDATLTTPFTLAMPMAISSKWQAGKSPTCPPSNWRKLPIQSASISSSALVLILCGQRFLDCWIDVAKEEIKDTCIIQQTASRPL